MVNIKKTAQDKPLIELVDLGNLQVVAESVAPSKGCGCTPPIQPQVSAS